MKEQIREVINLIEKETGYIDNGGLENTLETLLKEQKQETIEGERKRIKNLFNKDCFYASKKLLTSELVNRIIRNANVEDERVREPFVMAIVSDFLLRIFDVIEDQLKQEKQ